MIAKKKYSPTVAPGGKVFCPLGCTVVAFYDFPDLFSHLFTDHFYTGRAALLLYNLTPEWCSGYMKLSGACNMIFGLRCDLYKAVCKAFGTPSLPRPLDP